MITNKKGFTMIELLGAIVILGILSVLAITGATRLIDKSKKEQDATSKETLKMSAQSYLEANPSKAPKLVGDSVDIPAKELKNKKYLKEDIVNSKSEDCMNNSFVKVIRKSNTQFTYVSYLLCGEEAYEKDEKDKPTIDIYFIDSEGTEIEEYASVLSNMARESVYIKMTGGIDSTDGTELKLTGYQYEVFKVIDGNETEIYNSGSLSAGNRHEVVKQQKLSQFIDVAEVDDFNIKVIAINEKGVKATAESRKAYGDNKAPTCTLKVGESNKWINKKDYLDGKLRTIKVGCGDENSGCIRSTFTRTWPNDEERSAEYGYIQVKDNAGNKSVPDSYLRTSCGMDANNTCRVRVNVDTVLPTIVISSPALKNNVKAYDQKGTVTIKDNQYENLVDNWINGRNYPNGLELTATLSDDVGLDSWSWVTDKNTEKDSANVKGQYDCEKKNTINISLKAKGDRTGTLTVKDKAGNVTTVKVNANVDINKYTLTYDPKGGTACSPKYGYRGEEWGTLCTSTQNGYIFEYWYYSNDSGDHKITANTKVTKNLTVYAKWKLANYKCNAGYYLAKAATSCTICPINHYCVGGTYLYNTTKDQGLSDCPNGYPKTASTGKSKAADCYMDVGKDKYVKTAKATSTTNCGTGQYSNAHTVQYGNTSSCSWTSYTISYNLNGGSVSGNPTSYTANTATFTLKNPTRSGYMFTGWTGTGLSSASTSVKITKGLTGNRSYTANWYKYCSSTWTPSKGEDFPNCGSIRREANVKMFRWTGAKAYNNRGIWYDLAVYACNCTMDNKDHGHVCNADAENVTVCHHTYKYSIIVYKSKAARDAALYGTYDVNSHIDEVCNKAADSDGFGYHGYKFFSGSIKDNWSDWKGKKKSVYTIGGRTTVDGSLSVTNACKKACEIKY